MKNKTKQYIFAIAFLPIIAFQVGLDKFGYWLTDRADDIEKWYLKLGEKICVKFKIEMEK